MAARCCRAVAHRLMLGRRAGHRRCREGLSGMKILAMDTAAGACSGALWSNAVVVERVQLMQRGPTPEVLLPMLVSIMHEAGCAFADLDLIAVTVGPGAFTGLRVGLAAAGESPWHPLYPASAYLRWRRSRRRSTGRRWWIARLSSCSMTSATASMRNCSAAGRALAPPGVETPKRLGERLSGRRLAVAGDGAAIVTEALRAAGCDIEPLAVPEYPTASRVAAIAGRRWVSGERTGASPAPIYLRSPATGPQQGRVTGR